MQIVDVIVADKAKNIKEIKGLGSAIFARDSESFAYLYTCKCTLGQI